MSHFTVLVIGNDPAAQLAPFHEFECTGTDDQYVQNIDETPELREDYETGTRRMVKMPEGVMVNGEQQKELLIHTTLGTLLPYSHASLYQDHPTEKDFSGKAKQVRVLPEGYEDIEVPKKDIMTWRDYVLEHLCCDESDLAVMTEGALATLTQPYPEKYKWGFVIQNEDGEIVKVVNRTNPNKKWDWYQAGGRWSGMLKVKEGRDGQLGSPGVFGNKPRENYADSVRIGDIDFAGMRADAEAAAATDYDRKIALIERCTGLEDYTAWDQLRALYMPQNEKGEIDHTGKVLPVKAGGIEAARAAYHAQEFLTSLAEVKKKVIEESKAAGKSRDDYEWVHWFEHDDYLKSREQFIREAGLRAGLTYAIVKDYQWYQRGEMGWFGMSSGEVSEAQWLEEFGKLIDGLPEDTLLTVIDCHI